MYSNGVATTRAGVKKCCVSEGTIVESKCTLESDPFPPMSSVLRGVLIPDDKRFASCVDGSLDAAVRSPGGCLGKET